MTVDRAAFATWIDGYERAWRTEGAALLRELFAEHASYRHSPAAEPVTGIDAIAADWERERDGADEAFTMAAEIVAVDGDTGVARVSVRYGDPVKEYLDLWLVRFDEAGRCVDFEEWWVPAPSE